MYATMKSSENEIQKLPVRLKCIVSSYDLSSSGVLNNRVRETSISGCRLSLPGSSSMQLLWSKNGNRKWSVFPFNLISYYHLYIFEYLFPRKDDQFRNVGETTVLAGEMFTSGFRPRLKNVACSLIGSLSKDNVNGNDDARRQWYDWLNDEK